MNHLIHIGFHLISNCRTDNITRLQTENLHVTIFTNTKITRKCTRGLLRSSGDDRSSRSENLRPHFRRTLILVLGVRDDSENWELQFWRVSGSDAVKMLLSAFSSLTPCLLKSNSKKSNKPWLFGFSYNPLIFQL